VLTAQPARGNGTAPSVRVQLLSGFELIGNGRPVPLPLSVQRLVAFLALGNRPLMRLYVAGTLWLDSSEERSAASLRSALWRLHCQSARALRLPGYRVVESKGSTLRLARGVGVDAHEVASLARRLLERRSDPDSATPTDALAAELLPDWYDDWVVLEREQLRELCVRALEAHAERLISAGTYERAADSAFAAVRSDPLRESAHRLLIRVHLAEGNWGDAVNQYRLYAKLLRKQLGLRPSPQIEALVNGLPRADR
jgi:DNA-binding SARP family transcriptional activator